MIKKLAKLATLPQYSKNDNFTLALVDYLYNELKLNGISARRENSYVKVALSNKYEDKFEHIIIDCCDGKMYLRGKDCKDKRWGKLSKFNLKRKSDAYVCANYNARRIINRIKKLENKMMNKLEEIKQSKITLAAKEVNDNISYFLDGIENIDEPQTEPVEIIILPKEEMDNLQYGDEEIIDLDDEDYIDVVGEDEIIDIDDNDVIDFVPYYELDDDVEGIPYYELDDDLGESYTFSPNLSEGEVYNTFDDIMNDNIIELEDDTEAYPYYELDDDVEAVPYYDLDSSDEPVEAYIITQPMSEEELDSLLKDLTEDNVCYLNETDTAVEYPYIDLDEKIATAEDNVGDEVPIDDVKIQGQIIPFVYFEGKVYVGKEGQAQETIVYEQLGEKAKDANSYGFGHIAGDVAFIDVSEGCSPEEVAKAVVKDGSANKAYTSPKRTKYITRLANNRLALVCGV